MIPKWEEYADGTQRLPVDGGWLYRASSWVELPSGHDEPNRGYVHWSDPVFVPHPADARAVRDEDGNRVLCPAEIAAREGANR